MVGVFFSYSHVDEKLRDQIEKQLAVLKRQGLIETWHDRRISAGSDIHKSIDERVNSDEIVLLLVSSDFLASDYCYDIEMKRVLERQANREAIVIPVILRACEWHHAPFGRLNAVPRDGKCITQLPDIDEAMLQVAQAVREAAQTINGKKDKKTIRQTASESHSHPVEKPRSSNLRLAKTFTQKEKDSFKLDAFEYIAKFFENSLQEIGERNSGIEGVFRRVDANRFFSAVYKNGEDVSRCTIFLGGSVFGDGINYVHGEVTSSNTINESLLIMADDQKIYLSSTGFSNFGNGASQKLSLEGGAEFLWEIFIKHLQ